MHEGHGKKLEGIDSKAGGMVRILELLEGGVGGDGVGHVLCALWHTVAPEPANEGHGKTLRGIDSTRMGTVVGQRT